MVRTSPTFRRRRLARRIRYLRERAGLTQEHAACELDMSTSALSRKENGDVITSVHEARSMMDLYDIRDPELLDLARAARERGWWRAYGVEDRGYVDLETEACFVRDFQVTTVPGLLQTEDYARALFQSGRIGASPEQIRNDLAVRMIRRQRLTDVENPLELRAVVDEAALWRTVGERRVMYEQVVHLAECAEMPTVELQVLPLGSGAHCAMNGAFTLLEFAEPADPEVLYVEYPTGSLHVEKASEVRAGRLLFEDLRSSALDFQESVKLIKKVAEKL
ncbi:Helix-turn-helix domain-containing protein [Actinopolyspora lacussalsi subsp. righensis]|uniref:Helix-turn-helix domain-containing protein n=3 Tax=Actinopolyspora TaxID=1849 RepID=A0A1G8XDA1_ACTMZ|nr:MULTISPECIES: helix-turn-helix transcriptional regulator [Actinopolyspora]SDJ88451.1 Helix-turn-helix domain-containing protein [Actinopolyspora mzabensis]SDP74044.1 Helix-turn-helix domain-containing protein [Actinopolyspora xinjiangensis]SFT92543.1 Helix-turn-helix domain-containing protein [Actinopolyspora righensis]